MAQSIITRQREALLEKLIPAYAVVLVVDGTDAAQTKRAIPPQSRPSATKLMPDMPKPVEHPPVVVRLPATAWRRRLFAVDLFDTSPTPEPQAVVDGAAAGGRVDAAG